MATFNPSAFRSKEALWLLFPAGSLAVCIWAWFEPDPRSVGRVFVFAGLAQIPFFWHLRRRLAWEWTTIIRKQPLWLTIVQLVLVLGLPMAFALIFSALRR